MTVVLGIIAAVIVLLLLLRFPVPTLAGFVVVVGGIGLFIASTGLRDQDGDVRVPSPISASDVELDDLTLRQSGSTWQLAGTVRNNSFLMLTQLRVLIQIENCEPGGGPCTVVGQDVVSIYEDVPSGQSGMISDFVDFSGLPVLNDWRWTYRITEVRGE